MPRPNLEQLVLEGRVREFNEYRRANPDIIVNLSRISFMQLVDLSGINLSGADLVEASFAGIPLVGANFCNANLMGAHFICSNISSANFTEANLSEAVFFENSIDGTLFTRARFAGAVCINLDYEKMRSQGADLIDAHLDPKVSIVQFAFVSFSEDLEEGSSKPKGSRVPTHRGSNAIN